MILIITPGFQRFDSFNHQQLPGAVRMAGTSVFRIRIEKIFRRCWNLITPWRSTGAPLPTSGLSRHLWPWIAGADRPAMTAAEIGLTSGLPRLVQGPSRKRHAAPVAIN